MPLVHISLRSGKPDAYRQAIFDGIYGALTETFNVPDDDQFMTITQHDASDFRFGASYAGIARSDDVVFIQISAMNTRTPEQKKALYKAIAGKLGTNPGIRPEDVFVNLIEGVRENWSLGNGLAQYA
ncbi:tautomerase family protein [Xanthobacter sp. V3C-3]|uniref:tautomerase family protein n=1 Tax=Xanthobacter lutulentifluminis TaxID=3119935 RepID=UPI0037278F7C